MTSRVGSSLARLQCPAQDSLDLSSPLLAAYHCIVITIASIYSYLVISKCRASTSSNLSMVCQYSNKLYPNSNCNSNLPVFIYTFIVVNDTVVWRINFLIFIFRILLSFNTSIRSRPFLVGFEQSVYWRWGLDSRRALNSLNCMRKTGKLSSFSCTKSLKTISNQMIPNFFPKTTHTTELLSKWKTGRYTTNLSFIPNRRDLTFFRRE